MAKKQTDEEFLRVRAVISTRPNVQKRLRTIAEALPRLRRIEAAALAFIEARGRYSSALDERQAVRELEMATRPAVQPLTGRRG